MASLTPSPKMQFFDANGDPLAGGKLYTYEAGGTSTPQATYTDAGGGTPNANPVVLDSRGEASVWLGSSLYYIVLKDSADVQIWTADNIGGIMTLAALAASGGSALVGHLPSGAGAVATTAADQLHTLQSMIVSVKDAPFYALGDSTNDDTAEIQLAVDTPVDNSSSRYFPETGTNDYYKITAAIDTSGVDRVRLQGAGRWNSQIRQVTAGASAIDSNRTWATSDNGHTLNNVYLHGNSTGLYGAKWKALSRSDISDCVVRAFAAANGAGLYVEDTLGLNVTNSQFDSNYNGIKEQSGANTNWNGGGVRGCYISSNTNIGISADYMNGQAHVGNVLESNAVGGMCVVDGGGGLFIGGNYFEANQTNGGAGEYYDLSLGSNSYVKGYEVTGNYFNGTSVHTTDYFPIRIKYGNGIHLGKNLLNTGSKYLKFAAGANVSNFHADIPGFNTGSFDSTPGGADATFQNIPANFTNTTSENYIQGVTHHSGIPNQYYTRYGEIPVFLEAWGTATLTGTGSINREGKGTYVNTGATAGSTAYASINGMALMAGDGQSNTNYSQEHSFEWMVSNVVAGAATGESWIRISTAAAATDPATRSFGFKILQSGGNATLHGQVHDGTTLNTVDLGVNLSTGAATHLRVVKTTNACRWYVNGVLKGTTATNLPTGAGQNARMIIAVANGATAAAQYLGVYDCKYRVVQR